MRRLVGAVVLGLILALTLGGCTDLKDAVKARDECHAAGGKFTTWKWEGGYAWECDLSDTEESDR